MTVQELIDELNKIQNKSLPVIDSSEFLLDEVEVNNKDVTLYFEDVE